MILLACAAITATNLLMLGTGLDEHAARQTLRDYRRTAPEAVTSFCCVAGEQDVATGSQWPQCPRWVMKHITPQMDRMGACAEPFPLKDRPRFIRTDARCLI